MRYPTPRTDKVLAEMRPGLTGPQIIELSRGYRAAAFADLAAAAWRAAATFVSAVVEGFDAYRRYRRNVNEMMSRTDRELADMGISRSMVRTVAVYGAYRIADTLVADRSAGNANEELRGARTPSRSTPAPAAEGERVHSQLSA
jgi:uncharacterized protein YjiS (DUF1127 family)